MNVICECVTYTCTCLPEFRSASMCLYVFVCLHSSHLQHVADIEDGAVLSGVHVWHDVTVFVLDGHTPARKLHHLSPMMPVEVEQRRLLQGSLGGNIKHHTEIHNKCVFPPRLNWIFNNSMFCKQHSDEGHNKTSYKYTTLFIVWSDSQTTERQVSPNLWTSPWRGLISAAAQMYHGTECVGVSHKTRTHTFLQNCSSPKSAINLNEQTGERRSFWL